jgi:hypothetical protein
MADVVLDLNTTRVMGLAPVNTLQATSVVGHRPATDDDEFVIQRVGANRKIDRKVKTSADLRLEDHRGNRQS